MSNMVVMVHLMSYIVVMVHMISCTCHGSVIFSVFVFSSSKI